MSEDRGDVLARFSEWLAALLDLPALDDKVVERAMADPLFLNRLVMSRKDPAAVQAMLELGAQPLPKWAVPATLQSMGRVASALARWAAIGFQPVDDTVLQTRISSCRRCPHITAPGHMLVKIVANTSQVCGLCSCAIEKKAILPTETCPAADPERPGYNRWNEPMNHVGPIELPNPSAS